MLAAGKNEVSISLHMRYFPLQAKLGRVTELGIFMHKPEKGEAVWVDNIRLDSQGDFCAEPSLLNPWYANGFCAAGAADWSRNKTLPRFKLAGTDRVVQGIKDLKSSPVPEGTIEEHESAFAGRYEELKAKHPRAVLVTLRDGENGYQGWRDSFISCHSPDGADSWRMSTSGKKTTLENFMRHRSVEPRPWRRLTLPLQLLPTRQFGG